MTLRVQGMLQGLLKEVKAMKETSSRAMTAEAARPMIEEALESRLAKVTMRLDGLSEHIAQAVASDVRSATHKEVQALSDALAPTIEAAVRKEVDAQAVTGKEVLKASIDAVKAHQAGDAPS